MCTSYIAFQQWKPFCLDCSLDLCSIAPFYDIPLKSFLHYMAFMPFISSQKEIVETFWPSSRIKQSDFFQRYIYSPIKHIAPSHHLGQRRKWQFAGLQSTYTSGQPKWKHRAAISPEPAPNLKSCWENWSFTAFCVIMLPIKDPKAYSKPDPAHYLECKKKTKWKLV